MTVEGIDVSYCQGLIDWKRVRDAGIVFAYCKATEGVSIKDNTFVKNVKEASDVGIAVGAYHFFRPAFDTQEQVKRFRDACAGLTLTLPPCLDLEIGGFADTCQRANAWLASADLAFDRSPIVYTFPSFVAENIRGRSGSELLQARPLWIAHYREPPSPGRPMATPPWLSWVFHQYTNQGRVDGIETVVDCNVFNGTDFDLPMLGLKAMPPVPVTENIDGVIDSGSNTEQ